MACLAFDGPRFVFVRARNTRQTIRQSFFGLILSNQTIQTSFFSTGGLVLPSNTFGTNGGVGINSERVFPGRAILTKSGAGGTERSILAWNAIASRIVKINVFRVVRNEGIGRAYFALENVQCCFVLVATTTTNDAWLCFGDVFVATFSTNFAVAEGYMLGHVVCFVQKVSTRGARFASCGWGCAAVLVFARLAYGTERLVNVRTAKGATFTGHVFNVKSAVVFNVLSNLAKVAGNVKMQVSLVLIVTGWTNCTFQILGID